MRFKKRHIVIAAATAIATGVVAYHSVIPTANCDPTLWQHIYNPQRLHVLETCKTVEGTVEVIRIEKDGDFHILLNVTDKSLLNPVNVAKQHGDLVIEPICENPVSQQDVLDQGSCNGFSQNFHLQVGKTYRVTGAYVLDTEHGWNEIHPISKIE